MSYVDALLLTARPVRCKTGLATSRARNRKCVHRVEWISSASAGNRIRYFAGWLCGDWSLDVTIVADPEKVGRICQRCEMAARGEGFVYRCLNAAGHLLYIGSAIDAESRLRAHKAHSPWWPEVASTSVETYPDLAAARRAEAAAIAIEAPVHNKHHNKQRFRRAGDAYMPVEDAA